MNYVSSVFRMNELVDSRMEEIEKLKKIYSEF